MDVEKSFKESQEEIFHAKFVSDKDKLCLYGLYKQANVGDNTKDKPSVFSLKEHSKWNAWKSREGLSCEVSMRMYIDKVKEILSNCNV